MNNTFGKVLVWLVVIMVMFTVVQKFDTSRRGTENAMTYSRMMDEAKKGQIEKVEISGRTLTVTTKDKKDFKVADVRDIYMVSDLLKNGVEVNGKLEEEPNIIVSILGYLGPTLLIIIFWIFMMRQMNGGAGGMGGGKNNPFSFGRSKAKMMDQSTNLVTFADVAGCDEAKEEVKEIVDFLKEPSKFTKLGGRIPRGVLMVGSPGTGKTLLAKAIAGEAKVPFFAISGSDFVEMFVGVGASRVRDMFDQAKRNAPCIIFIDEIDAVGRKRGGGMGGGNDEREQTLNQMLVEMDGFETDQAIIVIAATNRADVLDPALLRPGRFDRQVTIGLPDKRGREQILKVHLRKVPLAQSVDAGEVAKATPGFSGAELANLINEAALFAARRGGNAITMSDLEEAKDKVMMGAARRSMIISDEEKRATAFHEAGHALVGALLPASDPVYKATIIPRGRTLGVVWRLPEKDRISYHKEQMLADIAVAFGGRIAEEVFLDDISSGASQDYKQATRVAKAMVIQLGMGEGLSPMSYEPEENEGFMTHPVGLSEKTMEAVDAQIQAIVNKQYALAKKLILDNRDKMEALANGLILYETLDAEQIRDIVAGKPVQPPKMISYDEGTITPAANSVTAETTAS